jgi:purine nucleosidase
MLKFIIDTDPGVDDAHAILLALAYPGITLEAITTVNGNVSLAHTTANALKILDVAGKDIPVFAGCAAPLINEPDHATFVHGTDGLGDCNLPPSTRHVEKEHACNALVKLANAQPGEISLVCIGPLTNLAVALRLDPDLPAKFKKLVLMGGAHYGQGNTTNVTAEFNFFTDPEAAAMVLAAWPEVTIITWETTLAHMLTSNDLQRIFKLQTTKSRFFADTSRIIRTYIKDVLHQEVLFAADALAVAVAIEPAIVKHSERRSAFIELGGLHTRGQLCLDWMGTHNKPSNAEIVMEIDQARFIELFVNGLK